MNNIVESKRIQYTASKFAKESLIYLQEVGTSKTLKQHTNSRKDMDSFLFFVVLEGKGSVEYNKQVHKLSDGNCFFIDCHIPYSHSSDNWTITWIHFNGNNVRNIYDKYHDRNGKNVFETDDYLKYRDLLNDIYETAESNDHIKDMSIFYKIVHLLNMIMSETIYEDYSTNRKYDLSIIKKYIDNRFTDEISLNDLEKKFYINKFYLTRIFKENYGMTINNYILEKRITKAKELLRFSDLNMEGIAIRCGIKDANYFSRLFSKVEGISPKKYRELWKQ